MGPDIRKRTVSGAARGRKEIKMRKAGLRTLGFVSALLLGSSITVMAESDGMEIIEAEGDAGYASGLVTGTRIPEEYLYEGLRLVDGKWIYVRNNAKDSSVNGLVYYEAGKEWFYVRDGEVDLALTGFAEYDGGQFYIAGGRVCREASGLVQDPGTKEWRYVAEGQVQRQYTGLAQYDGAWFMLAEGVKQESFSGLYPYDGAYFLIADGQILNSYSGLFQYRDAWYFIADGMVSSYTGLAEYDGAWFYIANGMLNSSFTGNVKYNGSWFYIENGVLRTDSPGAALLVKLQADRDACKSNAESVLSYVNQYRSEVGASALVLDEDLCLAAALRAQEMADTNVLSHTRPDGSSCFTVLEQFSIPHRASGENIASGYADAQSVCNGWYHSEGHYRNMVSGNYGRIGVGMAVSKNGMPYWVQLFGD